MEDIQQYFTKQEEEISNTFLSANGDMEEIIVSDSVKKANAQKQAGTHWSQNPLVSWAICDGWDYGCGLRRLAIFGVIAYVGYRIIKKKK